jgi:hypothetical protein
MTVRSMPENLRVLSEYSKSRITFDVRCRSPRFPANKGFKPPAP